MVAKPRCKIHNKVKIKMGYVWYCLDCEIDKLKNNTVPFRDSQVFLVGELAGIQKCRK
jgi:hypothetical protein